MKRLLFSAILFTMLFNQTDQLIAGDKTQSLNFLQDVINDPQKARALRKAYKNPSKEELSQINEIHRVINGEIKKNIRCSSFKKLMNTLCLNQSLLSARI